LLGYAMVQSHVTVMMSLFMALVQGLYNHIQVSLQGFGFE